MGKVLTRIKWLLVVGFMFFPLGGPPMAPTCAVQAHIQDGWSVACTNQRPLALGWLFRRPRALGRSRPSARPAELLQIVLEMRHQVCSRLALAPLADDSFEAYMAHTQRSLVEMREVTQKRSVLLGLAGVALRRLQLLVQRQEYEWLGDFPKEAARRRQTIEPR
jgi:hypothetical protein